MLFYTYTPLLPVFTMGTEIMEFLCVFLLIVYTIKIIFIYSDKSENIIFFLHILNTIYMKIVAIYIIIVNSKLEISSENNIDFCWDSWVVCMCKFCKYSENKYELKITLAHTIILLFYLPIPT